jgi:hypothetical protein
VSKAHALVVGWCLAAAAGTASAAPACIVEQTTNIVVMSIKPAPSGRSWLQGTSSSAHFALERCSVKEQPDGLCYFAVNFPPGHYYFQQVLTSALDDLTYLVSTPSAWFERPWN